MRPELSRDKTVGAGREMITIKDIARESGYSVGTVSRVLNGHKNVSDKARTQIMAVVDKYNFQLNGNAKLLKQRGTRGIAVLLKGTQHMLFNALTELFQRKLDEFEYGCDVFYLNAMYSISMRTIMRWSLRSVSAGRRNLRESSSLARI